MIGEVDVSEMSECAQAYFAEYGQLPQDRAEQDRYSAFRFGFEAGNRSGRQSAFRQAAAALLNKADKPWDETV